MGWDVSKEHCPRPPITQCPSPIAHRPLLAVHKPLPSTQCPHQVASCGQKSQASGCVQGAGKIDMRLVGDELQLACACITGCEAEDSAASQTAPARSGEVAWGAGRG